MERSISNSQQKSKLPYVIIIILFVANLLFFLENEDLAYQVEKLETQIEDFYKDNTNNDGSYNTGYDDGYSDGFSAGFKDGGNDGFDAGYNEGYGEGYYVGYDDALEGKEANP